jgi:hypothetical protein
MSHFAKLSAERGIRSIAETISLKQDKMRQLMQSGLPQYDCCILPYSEFREENKSLMQFYEEHLSKGRGFCVRALPTLEGLEKGLTREFKFGFLTFKDSQEFLEKIIKANVSLYEVGLTSWVPQDYGLVIMSGIGGGRYIVGEIAEKLNKLTAGECNPLAGFTTDLALVGHIEDKTKWHAEDHKSKALLWRAFRENICVGDGLEPFVWRGYFEAVIAKSGKTYFIDYDPNFSLG